MKGFTAIRGGSTNTSDVDKFAAAVIAGMASAMVQSPFQLVDLNQQNHGGNMASMTRRVISTHGIRHGLYRGASMTAVREGIFCSSYIALAPFVKGKLLEQQPDMPEATAVAVSSVLSGSLGAFISHPADTLKTLLQGSLLPFRDGRASLRASGPWEALKELERQGPLLRQCYRGFLPRVFRLVCSNYIYSRLTTIFEDAARDFVVGNNDSFVGNHAVLQPSS